MLKLIIGSVANNAAIKTVCAVTRNVSKPWIGAMCVQVYPETDSVAPIDGEFVDKYSGSSMPLTPEIAAKITGVDELAYMLVPADASELEAMYAEMALEIVERYVNPANAEYATQGLNIGGIDPAPILAERGFEFTADLYGDEAAANIGIFSACHRLTSLAGPLIVALKGRKPLRFPWLGATYDVFDRAGLSDNVLVKAAAQIEFVENDPRRPARVTRAPAFSHSSPSNAVDGDGTLF